MSGGGEPMASDATVHDDRGGGPINLPSDRREQFLREFNRTYASIGLVIEPTRESTPQDSDGSTSSRRSFGRQC